jgi:hypothetical protein
LPVSVGIHVTSKKPFNILEFTLETINCLIGYKDHRTYSDQSRLLTLAQMSNTSRLLPPNMWRHRSPGVKQKGVTPASSGNKMRHTWETVRTITLATVCVERVLNLQLRSIAGVSDLRIRNC